MRWQHFYTSCRSILNTNSQRVRRCPCRALVGDERAFETATSHALARMPSRWTFVRRLGEREASVYRLKASFQSLAVKVRCLVWRVAICSYIKGVPNKRLRLRRLSITYAYT